MDQYSREFIAEKARLRPEDLGLVRTARRSHNQLGLAYQIAFIRLTGRAPGQQPFEILEDLSPKIGNSLFGSHSRDRVRAENLRALLAADLKSAIDDKRTAGGLVTGTPRFGSRPRGGHPGAAPPQPRPGWKAELR